MQTHIEAALIEGRPLDHVLLVGPPGCGKSKLAEIIMTEMREENCISFIMPIDARLLDRLFRQFEGIVFFDEIHRMSNKDQHVLLSVLQDGYYQTKGGQRFEVADLTVIGATTDPQQLIKPVYDRFPIKPEFEDYTDEELTNIATKMAEAEGVQLAQETLEAIGKASLGVPRLIERLVVMARDLTITNGKIPTTKELFDICRVTPTGLSALHVRYCQMLSQAGGQAGLDLMRQLMQLPSGALEAIEVDLIKQKMIERTSGGRLLTIQGQRLSEYGDATPQRKRRRRER